MGPRPSHALTAYIADTTSNRVQAGQIAEEVGGRRPARLPGRRGRPACDAQPLSGDTGRPIEDHDQDAPRGCLRGLMRTPCPGRPHRVESVLMS